MPIRPPSKGWFRWDCGARSLVKAEAIKAMVIASEAGQYHAMVPGMKAIQEALNAGNEETAEEVLTTLVDCASAAPKICTKERFAPITRRRC